jgi:hypothetical protein
LHFVRHHPLSRHFDLRHGAITSESSPGIATPEPEPVPAMESASDSTSFPPLGYNKFRHHR